MAKILVADDNSNIQKMVGLALKDQGIDVVAVGNGEAAVRKISAMRPDLVLADVFMPVRNGYEVCRYVKEDSSLAHIPVILLVGAFDPLDEQEAQRVGADGVLKKPFVPPDPLISMVKSALSRAGVSLGAAPAAEKTAPPPSKRPAEVPAFNLGSKLPTLPPETVPQATPEPVEEFAPPPREQFKIDAGDQPLAFGNLLDTKEEEEVFTSKPMIELATDRNWTDETSEVPEEEEEESPTRGGWQPSSTLDERMEQATAPAKGQSDWRDALRGSSPAKSDASHQWADTVEQPGLVEATAVPSAAVSTLDRKPEAHLPGDAWASSVAADVEEKVAGLSEAAAPTAKTEPVEEREEEVRAELPDSAAASLESAATENSSAAPAGLGNWAAVPETSWEAEAKRASMLASTWDAAPAPATEEAQEVSAYTSEEHPVTHEEEPVETSAYSGYATTDHEIAEAPATEPEEAVAEEAASTPPATQLESQWQEPESAPAAEIAGEPEIFAVHSQPVAEAPAEIHEPAEPQSTEENMDELVARVVAKMNPEVLQKVTQEILKPVIEALIREELNSKKS